MNMICPICKGRIERKKIQYNLLGENLGLFPADVCQKCGEQFFNKETALMIENVAKTKGLWDLNSKTTISQVGNSLAIKINKRLSKFLDLKKGEEVIIQPENKYRIIIGKINP